MSQFDTLSDIKSETTYHNYNHTNLYEPDISMNAEPYSGTVSIGGDTLSQSNGCFSIRMVDWSWSSWWSRVSYEPSR